MRWFLLVLCVALATTACAKTSDPAADRQDHAAEIPTVTVDELDRMLAAKKGQAVDANGEGTRRKLGVIPGAVLLSDSEVFSTRELPADKSTQLVFYCANTHCGASHEAAGKAMTAGYKNVKVLPEGIAGWAKAGKPVDKVDG